MQPTKEQVCAYMQQRKAAHCPPLGQKEINRKLGRDLIEAKREEKRRKGLSDETKAKISAASRAYRERSGNQVQQEV